MDQLLPLVYEELHRLARAYLRRERRGHTLQPTALVNEAYLRLVGQHSVSWQNRAQFLGLAATMMRRILVNYAEAKHAAKRRGGERVTLDPSCAVGEPSSVDVLSLNQALERLAALDGQKARIVELRFFAGLTNDEVGEVVGKSRATVERDWTFARAWLQRELGA